MHSASTNRHPRFGPPAYHPPTVVLTVTFLAPGCLYRPLPRLPPRLRIRFQFHSEVKIYAAPALEGRRADPDYVLDADEESQLTQRVASVEAASSELLELLQMLVNACPWISKFNAMPSFGIGSVNDPYCRLCRAECMLALLILHVEGGQVSFLEEERLEVLSDVPPSAETALEAVRTAVASCPSG